MTVAEARAQLVQCTRDYGMARACYALSGGHHSEWLMRQTEVEVLNAIDLLIAAVRAEAVASPVGRLAAIREAFDIAQVSVEGNE